MRNSRRNTPDPISPQNPVIQKDVIDNNRVQDHLEEKTSVEEIFDPNDDLAANANKNKQQSYKGSNDSNLQDES